MADQEKPIGYDEARKALIVLSERMNPAQRGAIAAFVRAADQRSKAAIQTLQQSRRMKSAVIIMREAVALADTPEE